MGLSIHLEPVGPQHVPEVQKLVTSHPDIVGMTRMPDPYPDDGAATWIAQAVPLHEAGESFAFAIVRDDGQVVGMIGLIGAGGEAQSEAEISEGGGSEDGRAGGGRAEGGRAEGGRAEGGRVEDGQAEGGRAEMGYWVGGPFWNQGYATEAVRQLIALAFGELGVECVFATPVERNVASQHVLEKNGFGLVRVYPNKEPRWKPTDRLMEFELSRDQWAADRQELGSGRRRTR